MKIAAYCRVSTDKEDQKDSLAHQKEFFLEYARKNGFELFRLYADEGVSGTSLKKRTEFQHLMRDARLGLFELVVVKDVSRVARNTVDFLQSIRVLKSIGINVVFLTANMTSLGDSEFILTIFGAMAQEESGNLSKRVKWGKKINAKKGRVPQRIFGYDRLDNFTLQINPVEADIVRTIYRLYLSGLGCRGISLALNGEDAKTKFGCEWNPRGVRRVLTNPIYCGHYINNKYEIEDFLTGRQVRLPAEQNFHHDRPEWAIVTAEEFRRAQLQMEERRRICQTRSGRAVPTRHSAKHLFSTLIKCEHCGRSFCRRKYTYVNTRVYWVCSTNSQYSSAQCDNTVKIEEDELIAQIQTYLNLRIGDRDGFVKAVLAEARRRPAPGPDAASPEDIRRTRGRLLARRSRYQELYANDMITMAELKAKTAPIAEALAALDAAPDRPGPAAALPPDDEGLERRYTQAVERFLALETASSSDLRRIIDKITVNRDGTAQIILKKAGNAELPQTVPSWCL